MAKGGAASYSVGMPNFVALYALNASLRYLEEVGIETIEAHANPLVHRLEVGLSELGLVPMATHREGCASGILAIRHEASTEIHAAMEAAEVHIMHHAGRLRMAVHGYNTVSNVDRFLEVLRGTLV